MTLEQIVIAAARRTPEAVAVRAPDGQLTYAQLDGLANQFARALAELGVTRGDRVGLLMEKHTRTVAAMQGVLRLGAAYVPLDPNNPAARTEVLIGNCRMAAVVTTSSRAAQLSGGHGAALLTVDEDPAFSSAPLPPVNAGADELAYVLYTSGSTGVPKGVCISHRNAMAFIEWAYDLLAPAPEDRFSNHAPFFFDLSVLDLYVAFMSGASVTLIPDALAFAPRRLVELIQKEQITIWYSVPSALILMMEQGGLLEESSLPFRHLLFAGEPFAIRPLRRLRERLPQVRLYNLYGPTETNVCTWYEVREIDPARAEPVPIGKASCGDRVWLRPDDEAPDPSGEVGELMVEGPTVMLGYWNQPPQGDAPYPTGDLCRRLPDGNYEYLGRRDHMLKVRGRRMEPGEIEAALTIHPAVREAVVVASGSGLEARLVAFVIPEGAPPTLLDLKKHCAERLPRYMIIDLLRVVEAFPHTRNGKIDRRALRELAQAPQQEAR